MLITFSVGVQKQLSVPSHSCFVVGEPKVFLTVYGCCSVAHVNRIFLKNTIPYNKTITANT